MTENEAILIMDGATRDEHLYMYDAEDRPYLIARAENIALNALKEIQQYRAMQERLKKVYGECDGLLEVVVSGLERHEDLELPNITVKSRLLTDECVDMWDAYRAIGTIEEFKVLKEKNTPKKPNQVSKAMDKDKFVGLIGICPNCGSIVAEDNFVCEDCLQVLDWSERSAE